MHDELTQQLEFFRDIGVATLDVGAPAPARPAPAAGLQLIRTELGDCQRCKLAPSRTNIVFGSGSPNADLVFVGDAPGYDEDKFSIRAARTEHDVGARGSEFAPL